MWPTLWQSTRITRARRDISAQARRQRISPSALDPGTHVDYIRRVTFNISRVAAKTSSALTLAQPLIANPVVPGMSVQRVMAFVDREGSSFFQEWSGLFVVPADSGGRACFYYPRLQVAASGHEDAAGVGRAAVQPHAACQPACACPPPTLTTARRCCAIAATSRPSARRHTRGSSRAQTAVRRLSLLHAAQRLSAELSRGARLQASLPERAGPA